MALVPVALILVPVSLSVQEKYKRDQEKLKEEWLRAQEEVTKHEELQQRKREEELQRQEAEHKRREEESRQQKQREEELQRQQAERTWREQVERQKAEREQQWAKSKSTPELDDFVARNGRGTLYDEWRQKNGHQSQTVSVSELEAETRDVLHEMQNKGQARANTSVGEPLSQVELERQQILQGLRKTTQLHTDNSWIREHGTSIVQKEPVSPVGSMRSVYLLAYRGESLDNLDTPHSWRQSWSSGPAPSSPSYNRPSSALTGPRGFMRTGSSIQPGSLRQPSSSSFSAPASDPQTSSQLLNRSVSGRKICTSCELPLGKGAAMVIESLGLCFHLPCFKCVECKCDLGGSQLGAEVRIRNKQLYCSSCYVELKSEKEPSYNIQYRHH
ncbi:hypothetical protein Z043_110398 [Scleropages formosus]|uniref:LIM zinc-binding domain-containing protein n=1 Tax=Scleropages formosus TaxID=113540 RepID=A0A0N8JZZ9_SCLFO|nr:hypothetical protein Z043_110398 [Scleropages formosus]